MRCCLLGIMAASLFRLLASVTLRLQWLPSEQSHFVRPRSRALVFKSALRTSESSRLDPTPQSKYMDVT